MTTKVTVEVPAGANYRARVVQLNPSSPFTYVEPGKTKEFIVTNTMPISGIQEVGLGQP